MGNDTGVIRCGKCDHAATLIFDGFYYCSKHGLIVVLDRLDRASMLDDMRVGAGDRS